MNTTSYASPQPCGLGKKAVGELAERISEHTEFQTNPDLDALVQRLGGKILYQDIWELHSSESGSIEIRDDKDFSITLASHTSKARDRFTIAHELGHYFLHYRLPKLNGKDTGPLRAARAGNDQAETEANWFAASFLMPENSFREAFEISNGDLVVLANKFEVSMSAASVRAKSLGLAAK